MYIMIAYDHRKDHQTIHAGFPARLVDHLLAQPDPTTWSRQDHDKAYLRVKEAATATLPDRPERGTFNLIPALPHRRLARIQHLSPHNLTDRAALARESRFFCVV